MVTKVEAAAELLRRRKARADLHAYIQFVNPLYKASLFSRKVCSALDKFIVDMQEGKRPILILQAPPQHGKSEIVSRKLPGFLMGRFPDLNIGTASYADELASIMALDVRRLLASDEHIRLFPAAAEKRKYDVNRNGEFTTPGGKGSYKGVGVGSGLTGRPLDIAIVDDPIKNAQEALSPTTKEAIWNWYQTVLKTRLSERSGLIVMATSWAEDDLSGRIMQQHEGDSRLTILRFPAINDRDESGYNPEMPDGPLCPDLHSLEQLHEFKREMSDYWWSAMYQQSPKPLGGNVFKESGVRYYFPKDLPKKFDKVIASWDCTFKDTDGSDYVVGQIWGKKGPNAYLLAQTRDRMSFTRTVSEVVKQWEEWNRPRPVLIEDKANGPAVIDTLKKSVSAILPVEPDGSKLARAHAITAYWEAGNIWIPHPDVAPWVKGYVAELTAFPAAANDDQVDATTQAIRHLFPLRGRLVIAQAAIDRVMLR